MGSIGKLERGNGRAAESIAHTVIRKANPVWLGTTRAGSGLISIGTAVSDDKAVMFATYLESGRRSEPEELRDPAHVGCVVRNGAVSLRAAGYKSSALSARMLTLEADRVRLSRATSTLRDAHSTGSGQMFLNALLMGNAISSRERCVPYRQTLIFNPSVRSCAAGILVDTSAKLWVWPRKNADPRLPAHCTVSPS